MLPDKARLGFELPPAKLRADHPYLGFPLSTAQPAPHDRGLLGGRVGRKGIRGEGGPGRLGLLARASWSVAAAAASSGTRRSSTRRKSSGLSPPRPALARACPNTRQHFWAQAEGEAEGADAGDEVADGGGLLGADAKGGLRREPVELEDVDGALEDAGGRPLHQGSALGQGRRRGKEEEEDGLGGGVEGSSVGLVGGVVVDGDVLLLLEAAVDEEGGVLQGHVAVTHRSLSVIVCQGWSLCLLGCP